MKKTKILYWIFTALLGILMLISGIPDMIKVPEAVEIVSTHLGYPTYFIVFIGVAKVLGAIAILVPGFNRLKEWAYAGFTFDLIAATYSTISVGDPASKWVTMIIPFAITGLSYYFFHKLLKEKTALTK
jgi:uncharacterized membrane protein